MDVFEKSGEKPVFFIQWHPMAHLVSLSKNYTHGTQLADWCVGKPVKNQSHAPTFSLTFPPFFQKMVRTKNKLLKEDQRLVIGNTVHAKVTAVLSSNAECL